MAYCQNCGKYLSSGETCDCINQQNSDAVFTEDETPDYQQNPQTDYNWNYQQNPQYDNYGRPVYDQYGQPITYDQFGNPVQLQQPNKKKSNVSCIIVFIVAIFLFIAFIFTIVFVPAMIGYTAKSKQVSKNNAAKTLLICASTAGVDMRDSGENMDGLYIIASDNSKNELFDNDIDTKQFIDKMEECIGNSVECDDWFVVIKDGVAEYVAVEVENGIGTYPPSSNSTEILFYTGSSDRQTVSKPELEFLYESAVNVIDVYYENQTNSALEEFEKAVSDAVETVQIDNTRLANADAKFLYTFLLDAIEDMDENKMEINGTYIIHKDESKNQIIDGDINLDELYSSLYYYHEPTADNWFAVVVDGMVEYVAVETRNGDFGTYPIESENQDKIAMYVAENWEESSLTDPADFDEIYTTALNTLSYTE